MLALLRIHAAVEPLFQGSSADVSVGVAQVELVADLGGNLVCSGNGECTAVGGLVRWAATRACRGED